MCKKQNINLFYSCVWDADSLPLRNNRNSYFLTDYLIGIIFAQYFELIFSIRISFSKIRSLEMESEIISGCSWIRSLFKWAVRLLQVLRDKLAFNLRFLLRWVQLLNSVKCALLNTCQWSIDPLHSFPDGS